MKEFLKKLIASKEARAKEIKELIQKSTSIDEVRSLGTEIETVETELAEARSQLQAIENDEQRNAGFNPMQTVGTYSVDNQVARNENPRATMEYRTAFMNYVQKGILSDLLQKRDDSENVSGDLGILLPETIVQEIIKGVEKVYGQLYSRVKKTNLKGGIKYPVGSFGVKVYWDGTEGTDKEHGVSEKQKAGSVDGYVEFTYHIGEFRIAQSLLQSILTVDAFEKEIANAIVEAYLKSMDTIILNGDGVKQGTGILTEANKTSNSRIPAANVITFSAKDMADWSAWQKKVFAKIPLSMRKLRPEFVFTVETWESNILTLVDTNNRPVYRETYNPVTGDETATFKGREVVFVEEEGIKSFDSAAKGEYFGMLWVPEKAYSVNTNLEFSYKKYFDENTNQYITKGLVIVDGKVLDPKYIYLLKKGE